MTVRRTAADRNVPGDVGSETEPATSDRHCPLLTLRAAVILIAAVVTGIAAGVLAHLAGARPAEAVLAGGAACAGAITLLNALIA